MTVNAAIGKTDRKIFDNEGFFESWRSRDYLIKVDALVLGGSEVAPQAGDTIVETQGSKAYTYEVSAPDGEDVAEKTQFRNTWRIHTVFVSEAAV